MVDKFERLVENYGEAKGKGGEPEFLSDSDEYLFWVSDKHSREVPRHKLMTFYLELLVLKRRYQAEDSRYFKALEMICKRLSQDLKEKEMHDQYLASSQTYQKIDRYH